MKASILIMVAASVFSPGTSLAQDADLRASLLRCAALTDSSQRLVCYDTLSKTLLASAPATSATPGTAIDGRRDLKTPRKLKNVPPVYPALAKESRVQGVVTMEIQISAEGKVVDARVRRGVPELDQAAIDAVRQWTYEPTLVDGVPVPRVLTVTVAFRLN